MSDVAIRAENLSKLYRIGARQARYKTIRESLVDTLAAPFRGLPRNPQSNYIWALKDVSFDIKQGEVVGIIGRNGAGKSTLLKILSRITKPTEGRVEIRGRVGSLLEVGTGFHPELTGRENTYLNGAILGMKKAEIERKFDGIVAFAELERFIDTPVKHYSSGMYVRLAFAVAAHLQPEILLVDEVLAVGDVAFQKKCLGQLRHVATQGRTVFFVSHNLAAIKQLCHRGILIHEGRIRNEGSIGTVIESYIGAGANSRNPVDLAPEDHVTGINGIRVLSVTLLNGIGDSFVLPWKRPVRLAIALQVTRPLHNINLGLGITTLDGFPILTVHHTDKGAEPISLSPGFYRVQAEVENPLRLGTYNVILGAHEAVAKTSIFYIPNAIRLEVVSSTDTTDSYFDHNSGVITGSSTWQVSLDACDM